MSKSTLPLTSSKYKSTAIKKKAGQANQNGTFVQLLEMQKLLAESAKILPDMYKKDTSGSQKNFPIWMISFKLELINNAIDVVSLLQMKRLDCEYLEFSHEQESKEILQDDSNSWSWKLSELRT